MRLKAIVLNTFKEAARNRIFYLLIAFGILFALSSRLVSLLTIGDTVKVLKDIGLAVINFFSVLVAVFTGINLVYKEIDKKTIYNLLSKPISREQFIIGKFLGLALTVLAALAAMALVFFLFLLLTTGSFDAPILLYFLMLYFELLIIIAISLLFSSFSTPILSSIFTLSLYLIGHVLWTYNEFKYKLTEPAGRYLSDVLYYILPNLEKFNIKNAVVMKIPVAGDQILNAMLYALAYILSVLALSIAIFRRREFP